MNPWDVGSDFPTSGTLREQVAFLLRYAILAPSPHNNQPWKVHWNGDTLELRPDMAYVSSGTPRLTVECLGAFVENLAVAAGTYGLSVSVGDITQDTTLANVVIPLTFSNTAERGSLTTTDITSRHTNRGLYEPSLDDAEIATLAAVQAEPGVSVHLLTAEADREAIALMAGRGMRIAVTLPPLRRELANFVHWKREASETGMEVEAMVEHPADAPTGKEFILHTIDIAGESRFTYEKFRTAPLQIIVSTERDDIPSWFAAGRTIQRVLLTTAHLGLCHCIAAAVTEVPVFLGAVRKIIGSTNRPQLTIRVGRPQNPSFTHPSPRRPVSSILEQ